MNKKNGRYSLQSRRPSEQNECYYIKNIESSGRKFGVKDFIGLPQTLFYIKFTPNFQLIPPEICLRIVNKMTD